MRGSRSTTSIGCAAFLARFGSELPGTANTTHVLNVVASSVAEDAFELFEAFSHQSDGMVRPIRFQEFAVDDGETVIRTRRVT